MSFDDETTTTIRGDIRDEMRMKSDETPPALRLPRPDALVRETAGAEALVGLGVALLGFVYPFLPVLWLFLQQRRVRSLPPLGGLRSPPVV